MRKPTGCSPVRMARALAGERMGGTPTSTSLLPGRVRSPKLSVVPASAAAARPRQIAQRRRWRKRPAADRGGDDERGEHLEDDGVAVDREDREPQHVAHGAKGDENSERIAVGKGPLGRAPKGHERNAQKQDAIGDQHFVIGEQRIRDRARIGDEEKREFDGPPDAVRDELRVLIVAARQQRRAEQIVEVRKQRIARRMPEMQHPGAGDDEKAHRRRRAKRGEQQRLVAGTATHRQGGRQDADGKGHCGELQGTGGADEKSRARAMRHEGARAAARLALAQLEQLVTAPPTPEG